MKPWIVHAVDYHRINPISLSFDRSQDDLRRSNGIFIKRLYRGGSFIETDVADSYVRPDLLGQHRGRLGDPILVGDGRNDSDLHPGSSLGGISVGARFMRAGKAAFLSAPDQRI
jgi:hypothetical protein